MTLYTNYVSFFVNSVHLNLISDEVRAMLEMMKDEMNSKRGPDEQKLHIIRFLFDELDYI